MKSGWNQGWKPPPPSSGPVRVAEVFSLLRLLADRLTLRSAVLLLFFCCWLSSFSSGGRSKGGAKASMYSGYSSPGFGNVYWTMPVGLYRKNQRAPS